MSKLRTYLETLNQKVSYVEELYGFKINYLPLIIEGTTIVLDRKNGKLKIIEENRYLSDEEIKNLERKIIENIEKGIVELYLTITFGEDVGLGEG
ncbi:hypothetical protein E3E22_03100 [Thermococcus sp. MV5]|uniref:hypothetical protein n=1 Tax=Thermococcus sp. MV5 TaxID=1638272 RepID=UPI00143B70FF|nr:hypothetical protein [Thermococcus sp. MV5]NJE25623.1 hypothetical protein [Thermococcus sp. MV5]